jgi:hypothetical protein
VIMEQLKQGRGVNGANNTAAVRVEQADGQPDGARIFLQRDFPQIGAKERLIHATQVAFPFARSVRGIWRRSGARDTSPA